MNYPPTKRLRGLNQDIATGTAFDDPFGDDDSFTQDDLDEIDIIASQAFTTATSSGLGSKPGAKPGESSAGSVAQSRSSSRTTTNYNRESKFGFSSSNSRGRPSRDPLGDQHQRFLPDRDGAYSVLEDQHAELKRKLKEVEDEILLKNGEIRVLRDSLKGAQQEKEAQRQNQILLESQRQKEQSDREKELNRKVHSLQSELQFKEAEINEMKTKLLTSDKNKTASPLHLHSPKAPNSLAHLHHGSGSGSPSPTGNGFITKEIFSASVPSKATPVKKRREGREKASKGKPGDTQETSRPDPFLSHRPVHLQSRGGVLLGLLLQQPLSPSNLGLSHLLSMSPADINTTPSGMSAGFLLHSDAAVSSGEGEAALSPVQSLAITGLNMLSLSKPDAAASSRNKRSCTGAVLLLPLLDVHLSRLSQTVDSSRSTSNTGATNLVSADHAVQTGGPGRQEGTRLAGFSTEDIGLASLRLLFLLVAHSDEVVEAVLSKKNQIGSGDEKAECSAAGLGLYSQNALLQSLLLLCEGGQGSSSPQKKQLILKSMKTLCVLIERTPRTHSDRLLCVLQPMCVCLSADSRLQMVSQCVSILTSMCDHQPLARQLCSQHDPCVFLKLFQFIRTRTDNQATHTDWMQLDLQVIRLLSRLMTQGAGSWNASQHSSCQCYTELVQTVVIVFHRQWLDLRGPPELTELTDPASSSLPWWCGAAASLLRECLMLLYWLLLHHSSFSESCRPLLHMYDQVIPAVRDALRRIPELSESEELALEEICRSEGDDTDDMDTDNVS